MPKYTIIGIDIEESDTFRFLVEADTLEEATDKALQILRRSGANEGHISFVYEGNPRDLLGSQVVEFNFNEDCNEENSDDDDDDDSEEAFYGLNDDYENDEDEDEDE